MAAMGDPAEKVGFSISPAEPFSSNPRKTPSWKKLSS